jgi:succinate dehydrogenase / fumarate reductase cytochrome b subunit
MTITKLLNRSRPLSPHLRIYKLPFNAYTSIFHRISAVILVSIIIGTLVILQLMPLLWNHDIFWEFFQKYIFGFIYYNIYILNFTPNWILFLITFIFFYHAWNGIRHFLWDFGIGFEQKSLTISGIFSITLAFLSSLLLVDDYRIVDALLSIIIYILLVFIFYKFLKFIFKP